MQPYNSHKHISSFPKISFQNHLLTQNDHHALYMVRFTYIFDANPQKLPGEARELQRTGVLPVWGVGNHYVGVTRFVSHNVVDLGATRGLHTHKHNITYMLGILLALFALVNKNCDGFYFVSRLFLCVKMCFVHSLSFV